MDRLIDRQIDSFRNVQKCTQCIQLVEHTIFVYMDRESDGQIDGQLLNLFREILPICVYLTFIFLFFTHLLLYSLSTSLTLSSSLSRFGIQLLSLSLSLHSSKVTSVIPVDSYAREDEHLVLMTSQGNKKNLPLPLIYDGYILDKCCFNRFSVSSLISFFPTSHFYLFIY